MWRENIIHVQKQVKREKIYKTRYGWGERETVRFRFKECRLKRDNST